MGVSALKVSLRRFAAGFAVLATVAAGVCGGAFEATAESVVQAPVTVEAPWARPSTGKTGAVYFNITNNGSADDALVGVESDIADKVQIHEMKMDGAIMRMRKMDRLVLPAGKTVEVAPGGIHIMLIGLRQPLKEGDAFPLKLLLEKGSAIDVSVPVRAQGAMSGASHMNMQAPMDRMNMSAPKP
jgi:hypothetical protein